MSDPRELHLLQQIAERDAQIAAKENELALVRQENLLLRQKIDALSRRLFGKKSEQLSPDQLQLLFQELLAPGPAEGKESGPETAQTPAPLPKKKTSRRSPRLPEHLPVLEEVIEPEPVKAAPQLWRKIDEERSELLDYEPARFLKRVLIRPKYVRRDDPDAAPVIAPMPPRFLERSFATPSLVAQIITAKYVDHLPLYRQERIFATRHGLELSRQTMAGWMSVAADWLRPVYQQIRSQVLEGGIGEAGGYVQIDETPVRYLAPGHGETKQGYLWVCHRPGEDAVFFWNTGRGAECLEKVVPAGFRGVIQCDGYQAYDAFQRKRGGETSGIELAGCFAHMRRKFVEALGNAPKEAGLILHLLQNLYRTEARLRECRAGPKLRTVARELESAPVAERIRRTLAHWKEKKRFLPKSAMGEAITYALNQWESLLVCLRDGRLELDNNRVENAIRPTAVGKKNWLFIGHEQAGERGAILYTIVESCRRRGLDPYEYLRDVLTRLPSATNWQVKDLTPAAWAEEKRCQQLKAAA